jgi:hypothetical protein
MNKKSKIIFISISLFTMSIFKASAQTLLNIDDRLYNADSTLLKELVQDLQKNYLDEPLERCKKDSLKISPAYYAITQSQVISNYILKTRNLVSYFPDVPKKIKNELDSLEDKGLNLSAMAVVNSTNAAEKLKSLKSLGQYYLAHERVGDSIYLMRVQSDLQREAYKFPNVVPSLQVGIAQGGNTSIDASIMIGYMKPKNSALQEKYSYSGITLGGEWRIQPSNAIFVKGMIFQ